MTETTPRRDISRRTVLRQTGLAAGATLVGGAALVGTAGANPRTNYVYVTDDTPLDARYTLGTREGRAHISCLANIKTEVFTVEGSDKKIYCIPSGWEEGDTLQITGLVSDCASNMREVSVDLVV